MRRLGLLLLAGTIPALSSGPAARGATITYQYVTDSTSYAPGAPVSVYLQETYGSGGSLIVSDGGLQSAGFQVNRTSGSDSFSVAGNSSFNDGVIAHANNSAVTEFANPGVQPSNTGSNPDRVFLGTITVTAGSSPSTFTVGPYTPNSTVGGNTQTFTHGYDLDLANNGTGTAPPAGKDYSAASASQPFTVVATPEPGGLALAACAAAALLRRRRA